MSTVTEFQQMTLEEARMRTLMAMVLSGVLLVSAGIARADEQAVKERDEKWGKRASPPRHTGRGC